MRNRRNSSLYGIVFSPASNDSVAPRRPSDGHLDGVAASRRREDRIFPMLKFKFNTLSHRPNFIMSWPPCLKVCCIRIGSSAASSVSWMFSRSAHLPNLTAFSCVGPTPSRFREPRGRPGDHEDASASTRASSSSFFTPSQYQSSQKVFVREFRDVEAVHANVLVLGHPPDVAIRLALRVDEQRPVWDHAITTRPRLAHETRRRSHGPVDCVEVA